MDTSSKTQKDTLLEQRDPEGRLSKLSDVQMHQIVSRNLQASDPEAWERILLQAVYPDTEGALLTIRLPDGTAVSRKRDPLSTLYDLKAGLPKQTGVVKFVVAGEVLGMDSLVAMVPAEIQAVVVAWPRWYQAPSNCEILNDGFTIQCSTGTTGQWEAVYGHHETEGDLEFAVSLEALNSESADNVCIGVAPADFKPSTAGRLLNANAATVAFGAQGFPMNQHCFQVNDGKRWKQGDVVHVTSCAHTGDVKFYWDGEVRAELKAMPLQRPVRPVVFLWHKGDKVSFILP